MGILSSLFYIILFTTVMGAAFTLLSLLLSHVFRIVLPLWFGVLGMGLYVFPVLGPGLFLVSPEEQIWVEGYGAACGIWGCGIVLFVLYGLAKLLLAHRAVGSYRISGREPVNAVCASCAGRAGLKRVPTIYFGTLDDPACAMGAFRPAIILNEEVAAGLTETQLTAVLAHEVMHIRRKHLVFSRIYDWVCFLNWFNPFVWIARKEFDILCETDCDKNAIAVLEDRISAKEYALTMLHLLEVSAIRGHARENGFGALGFLLTKQRITLVLKRPSRLRTAISTIALILAVAAIICFSARASRGHFYPYPAYNTGTEFSDRE